MQSLQSSKKSEKTREKILSAAEAEFCEYGFSGARIDRISASADINKRMIYEHFSNKKGLYEAVIVSVYERMAEMERGLMIEDLDPETAIKKLITEYFRFLDGNHNFVRMLMWENLNNARSMSDEKVRALKNPVFEYIKGQIRRGKELGVFKADVDEYQIVVSTMNFVFSYFSNIYTLSAIFAKDMKAPEEISRRAEFVSEMIIKYLTA